MANDSIQFSISGLDSLLGKFDEISYDVRRKGGRSSLRKAAQLIAAAATENASQLNDPQTANEISKNIALRWNGKLFKSTGDLGFRVGVLGGAATYADDRFNRRKGIAGKSYVTDGSSKNPGGNTFYWRFLEFGTERMAAQPFMRRALADNIAEVTNTFVNEFDRALDRAIKRARKKAANL